MENHPDSPRLLWKWLLAVAITLMAVWWGYRWAYPSFQPPLQPVPNAYNDLVRLGGQLAPRTGLYDEVPEAELAAIVSANAPVLDQAREALRKESMVALDWNADEQWYSGVYMKRIQAFRELARAFAAEGYQVQKTGDSRPAIQCGLDNLHLAEAMSRGCLGTDWLTGIAIYGIGLSDLRQICSTASRDDCQRVLKNLPVVSKVFDPPAEITTREWHFWRRINGPYQTFLTELTFSNNRAEFERDLYGIATKNEAETDLLRLHYAIRAFQISENRLPKTLHELEGRELENIPLDPCSGRDFIYQPGKDRYILYSVGPNGVDDGGIENPQDPSQGDVLLKTSAESAQDALVR